VGTAMLTDSAPPPSARGRSPADDPFPADLAAGDLRVLLAPASGGRIAAFWSEGANGARVDILVPMAGPVADPLQWPKAGCYPLVPFSNRIRNGRFGFAGVDVQLPAHSSCAPHALHGFSQLRPWSIARRDERHAVMRYEHAPDAWPWAFVAEQRLSLTPDALTIELVICNHADRAMPVGFGLHPYFAVEKGDRIAFSAGAEWRLPDAEAHYNAPHDDVATTRYFADWPRVATIARRAGPTIEMSAEAPLDHLVFHVPAGGAYACMEPVSHVADAFNLASRGVTNTGFQALSPHGEIAARVTIALRP
jgi:aldose 1-epimerase